MRYAQICSPLDSQVITSFVVDNSELHYGLSESKPPLGAPYLSCPVLMSIRSFYVSLYANLAGRGELWTVNDYSQRTAYEPAYYVLNPGGGIPPVGLLGKSSLLCVNSSYVDIPHV